MIYYGVKSCFFNDKITASMIQAEAEKKPENTKAILPKYDQYTDWFNTRQRAERYYNSVLEEAAV
jgi:hypothetical protein